MGQRQEKLLGGGAALSLKPTAIRRIRGNCISYQAPTWPTWPAPAWQAARLRFERIELCCDIALIDNQCTRHSSIYMYLDIKFHLIFGIQVPALDDTVLHWTFEAAPY